MVAAVWKERIGRVGVGPIKCVHGAAVSETHRVGTVLHTPDFGEQINVCQILWKGGCLLPISSVRTHRHVAGFTGDGRSNAVEIRPLYEINRPWPVDPTPKSQQEAATGQIVSAVHALNQSELLGAHRQLKFTWDTERRTV